MKIIIMDALLQLGILNGIWTEFLEYLAYDYRENVCVVKITRGKCAPNHAWVKYFHLLPGFSECPIFGDRFVGISPPLVDLSELGVCRDLLKVRREPIYITYGPNARTLDISSIDEMNRWMVLVLKSCNQLQDFTTLLDDC